MIKENKTLTEYTNRYQRREPHYNWPSWKTIISFGLLVFLFVFKIVLAGLLPHAPSNDAEKDLRRDREGRDMGTYVYI